jgi:hypothetical protein
MPASTSSRAADSTGAWACRLRYKGYWSIARESTGLLSELEGSNSRVHESTNALWGPRGPVEEEGFIVRKQEAPHRIARTGAARKGECLHDSPRSNRVPGARAGTSGLGATASERSLTTSAQQWLRRVRGARTGAVGQAFAFLRRAPRLLIEGDGRAPRDGPTLTTLRGR